MQAEEGAVSPRNRQAGGDVFPELTESDPFSQRPWGGAVCREQVQSEGLSGE